MKDDAQKSKISGTTLSGFWGEPISVYTQEQAIDDGILIPNPLIVFGECNALTANLWSNIQAVAKELGKEPVTILERILLQARYIYVNKLFTSDHDEAFFAFSVPGMDKQVWFVRNENDRLTAMLPEDY